MKQKTHPALHDSRIDYEWRVDRAAGFERTTLIYDAQGRLIAVDVKTASRSGEIKPSSTPQ